MLEINWNRGDFGSVFFCDLVIMVVEVVNINFVIICIFQVSDNGYGGVLFFYFFWINVVVL